jgi:hypothetical protein
LPECSGPEWLCPLRAFSWTNIRDVWKANQVQEKNTREKKKKTNSKFKIMVLFEEEMAIFHLLSGVTFYCPS